MTTIRLMLTTALFGSLALPVLAQPHVSAHQARTTHHRTMRHASPVHRIATTPETKAPAVATAPKPAVTMATPMAPMTGSTTAPAAVPGATMGTAPLATARTATTPRVVTTAPLATPAPAGTNPAGTNPAGTAPAGTVRN
jgi:hypothetical protein